MAGGGMRMALGAAKMAGKAFGFAKSKRAKRAMAMGGSGVGEKIMNAMGMMACDGDGETSSNQSHQERPLDFRHFWHATEGMSSRAGIITGLAGFWLGVATLATSKPTGARGGGFKGFLKTSWNWFCHTICGNW
ncbi:hypothetical protein [Spiroplasma endosymbiont of Agriotes lineatus]|uniref:hypothetical protein n=1 Tax=Spiroplasma endosymbiont of Agriotes lineatus TaxID=3077930 RepID=UPI0030CF6046